jgi:hypothetical protein
MANSSCLEMPGRKGLSGKPKPKGKNPKPPRRNGTPSYRDVARLPKGAGIKTQIQHKKNLAKEKSTMNKYRTGFHLLWHKIPKTMKRCKVTPPGSYDLRNHHGGQMPGWPFESTMTNDRVQRILFDLLNLKGDKRLTYSQLRKVRKMFSYFYELAGKKTKQDNNWPCIAPLLETVTTTMLQKNKKGMGQAAMYIPTVSQLRAAIEKGWNGKMPLQKWIVSYVCFWDTMICGARPKVDMTKIKLSTIHDGSYSQGWQRTAFKDGRAKLTGMKKGTRPWSMWRISEPALSTFIQTRGTPVH